MTLTIPASQSHVLTRSNGNPTISLVSALVFSLVICSSNTFSQEVCPAPVLTSKAPLASAIVDVPILNSYPQSNKVLYLDFDGDTSLTSAAWGLTNMVLLPANVTAEAVIEAFNITKQDYILWDLNVTTEKAKYDAADPNKRVRVIITATSSWYGANAGGVAYPGSFTWGDNTPAFVFSDRLGNFGKYMGECISHEAGHTFGLQHQSRWVNGVRTETYHSGTGSPGTATSWAPFMGVSYYASNTTLANGLTSSGTVADEVAIVESNGLLRRPVSPSIVRPNATTVNSFTVAQRSLVTIAAKSGGNTDLKIKVNSFENNIADSLDCRMSITLDPGNYNLEVSPAINPNNPTGYGNFGQAFTSVFVQPLSVVPLRESDSRYTRERITLFRFDANYLYFKATIADSYTIFTVTGQQVRTGSYRSGVNEISTHGLPPGVYAFKSFFKTYKFLKN